MWAKSVDLSALEVITIFEARFEEGGRSDGDMCVKDIVVSLLRIITP